MAHGHVRIMPPRKPSPRSLTVTERMIRHCTELCIDAEMAQERADKFMKQAALRLYSSGFNYREISLALGISYHRARDLALTVKSKR